VLGILTYRKYVPVPPRRPPSQHAARYAFFLNECAVKQA